MAKILILDDDLELSKTWQTALQAACHEVDLSQHSDEALRLVETTRFNVMVVDLFLDAEITAPPDNAIRFLKELGASRRPSLIIGVTGYYGSDQGAMAMKLLETYGVNPVLLKPFEPEELVKLI